MGGGIVIDGGEDGEGSGEAHEDTTIERRESEDAGKCFFGKRWRSDGLASHSRSSDHFAFLF